MHETRSFRPVLLLNPAAVDADYRMDSRRRIDTCELHLRFIEIAPMFDPRVQFL